MPERSHLGHDRLAQQLCEPRDLDHHPVPERPRPGALPSSMFHPLRSGGSPTTFPEALRFRPPIAENMGRASS